MTGSGLFTKPSDKTSGFEEAFNRHTNFLDIRNKMRSILHRDLISPYREEESGKPDEIRDDYCVPISFSMTKRAIDFFTALFGLILFFPIMILVGIIIRLDSPGPAIFRQTRIGQNRRFQRWIRKPSGERREENLHGELFTFYKFRTLHADAKERWPGLFEYEYTPEEIETMRFKIPDDPRLTRVGRYLRRTTLDELPNFINILLGNMTLVGPRPDIPEMVRYYKPRQTKKFMVKPGLTGLAQISGRGHLTFQETLEKDVLYINNQSLKLDLSIIFITIKIIFRRHGAF